MRGFVQEELLRWLVRWDERGSRCWRANPKKLIDEILSSLSGARVTKQEKQEVSRSVQGLVRHKLLLDEAAQRLGSVDGSGAQGQWKRCLAAFRDGGWQELRHDVMLPAHLRESFPPKLFERLQQRFGPRTLDVCRTSNEMPGTFLRVNPLVAPGGREEVLAALQRHGISVEACASTVWGIRVKQGEEEEQCPRVTQLREYVVGAFELQDESSQLIADLVPRCEEGSVVVDLCTGSGGKALALLSSSVGRGSQLVLHDVRPVALRRAVARLRRSGTGWPGAEAPDVQVVHSAKQLRRRWAQKADWVLLDAPCTNTGSLRRHPECKYRLFETSPLLPDGRPEGPPRGDHDGHQELQESSSSSLAALLKTQRDLLEEAAGLLKPGGIVIYSTCSLLLEENELQADWAAHHLGLERCVPSPGEEVPGTAVIITRPFIGCFAPVPKQGRDGFFAAMLRRVC